MKILFVMEHRVNAGNTHAVATYSKVAEKLGHTIAFYAPPQAGMPDAKFSTDPRGFDRVVYLIESKMYRVGRLMEVAMFSTVPRAHRRVLDADARFNPVIVVDGYDRNYLSEAERVEYMNFYDAIADRIIKPTLAAPDSPRVKALPFFGFDPSLVVPPKAAPPKHYDILHVGHNWWRWKEVKEQLIPAFEKIRDQVGEIGFAGLWWDSLPDWAGSEGLEDALRIEGDAFRRLKIRADPPVPYTEVIWKMSTGKINIFTQRPVLAHLKHLTGRYFEEFCADTIPLLMLEPDFAEEVYGPAGRELALPGRVAERILDALRRPDHYRGIVEEVRRYLVAHHPYTRRVEELVAALDN
jgi:hypothetical protein